MCAFLCAFWIVWHQMALFSAPAAPAFHSLASAAPSVTFWRRQWYLPLLCLSNGIWACLSNEINENLNFRGDSVYPPNGALSNETNAFGRLKL